MDDCTTFEIEADNSLLRAIEKTPSLIVIEGDALGAVYVLRQKTTILGRGKDVDVQIRDVSVSRRHAMIEKIGDCFHLSDLGSTNSTELNGQIIMHAVLNDGDKFRIGRTVFKFCYQDNIETGYHRRLHNLAVKDDLTGIYNRRYFLQTFEKEMCFARRRGYPLSILLLDIDYFKNINDTYGHDAGDFVLKSVVKVIEDCIGGYDIFARYGGEEFIFLLRDNDLMAAIACAERIREMISQSMFVYNERKLRVTVSIGVATFDPLHHDDIPGEALIVEADRFLYEAKRQGRNRVCYPGMISG